MGSGRIRELDGLRALAVLGVISFHYTLGTPLENRASALGWAGVDLFFVLSGYLITGILLKARERERYFSTFYARRTLRIFPVYYLLLGFYFLAARIGGGAQPLAYWGMHAAFLSSTVEFFRSWNFAAPGFVYAGVTVLWSLSIEEQFYLLWAPLVRWVPKRALGWVLGGIVVAAPAMRWWLHTAAFPEYRFFPARIDSLAWGALLAVLLAHGRARTASNQALAPWLGRGCAAALGGFAVLWLATGGDRVSAAFAACGYSVLAILFAGVVGWCVVRAGSRGWICRGLRLRPAQYLAKISYTLYLVHYPVLLAVGGWVAWGAGGWGIAGRDVLSLGLAVGIAAASWRWVEAPLLAFKERWAPDGARAGEPVRPALRTHGVVA